jgi:hypothetical protein
MLKSRVLSQLSVAAGIAASAVLLAQGSGIAEKLQQTPVGEHLRHAHEFSSMSDPGARSRALFDEASKVLNSPRCLNCHPATRSPTQGDILHRHMPPMHAGEKGKGAAGLNCHSCHRVENTTVAGSRVGSVPGAEHWHLAPASMAWQGRTVREICHQIKDPSRNGGRSLDAIHKHVMTDPLVAWAWQPGEGRNSAPGTQQVFGELIAAWIASGAECP